MENQLLFLEKYAQYPDVVRFHLSFLLNGRRMSRDPNFPKYLQILDRMPKADRDILLAWLDYTIKKYEYEKKTKPLLDSIRKTPLVSSRLFRVIHHQQRWKISRILVLLWFVWRVFDYEIDNQRENKCPICYYLKNSFMKKSKAFLNMVVLTFLIAISMLSCQSNDDYLQIGIGNCESSNGTCPITVFH